MGELEALVAEHPTRERLRGQLMLALYRSGRQSEALESYQDARRTLDAELGLEPGPELRELEQEILNQDQAIAAPPRGGPAASSRRRRGGVLVAFGGGLLLAAAAAAIVAGGDEATARRGQLAGGDRPRVKPGRRHRADRHRPGRRRRRRRPRLGREPRRQQRDRGRPGDEGGGRDDLGTTSASGEWPPGPAASGSPTASARSSCGWIPPSRRRRASIRLAPEPAGLRGSPSTPVAVGHGAVWVAGRRGRDRAHRPRELRGRRHISR